MTRSVYSLEAEHSLPLADAMMGMLRIRHIPIVDKERCVIGLVTHRDLLAAKISVLAPMSEDDRSNVQLSVPISRIMRTEVWTIAPEALAVSAARLMRDHRIGCLPVVEGRRLVGIITEADLLSLVTDSLTLERPSKPWTVAHAMTPSPVTIDAATTITQARATMARYGVRHLPVVDGPWIGMVSDRDLRVADLVYAKAQGPVTAAHAASIVGTDAVRRVESAAPLESVLSDMFRERLDAVLVVNNHVLVGILTAADACRILGEHLRDAHPAPSRMPRA
jgi:CBS domain-containing membrane protein